MRTTQPATTPAPRSTAQADCSGLNPYLRILAGVELRRADGARLRLLVATPVLTVRRLHRRGSARCGVSSRSRHDHKRHTHADGSARAFVPGSNHPGNTPRPVRRRSYEHQAPQRDELGNPKDSPDRHVHPRHRRAAVAS